MNRLSAVGLLMLDDIGPRPNSPHGSDELYEIIPRLYERGSIPLASNRDPSVWAELFRNSLLGAAGLDRLTHHARIAAITGERCRQRQRPEAYKCEAP